MISTKYRALLRSTTPPATDAADAAEGMKIIGSTAMAPVTGTSIVIDCETLDKTPRSITTEIGAIAFNRADFEVVDKLEVFPDVWEQLTRRSLSADTIAFHRSKGTLPQKLDGTPVFIAAAMLADFIQRHRPVRVWIQGTCFERPLIESFFEDIGQPLPWHFTKSADARTLWDTAFPGQRHAPRPHHALPDCIATLPDIRSSLIALGRAHAC